MLTAEKLVELKHERFVVEMEDLSIVTPKVEQLLKNNHVGIALKRFVNREIEYVEGINSIITSKSTHVLRVESKKNGKRFNAVINYEPISFFPNGTVEKNNWPYQIIIDRRVPWSILLQHKEGHTWQDLKCRIKNNIMLLKFTDFEVINMTEKCPNCGYELHRRGSFSVDEKGHENWIKWQYYCKICDYSENNWRLGEEEEDHEDLVAEANINYMKEAI